MDDYHIVVEDGDAGVCAASGYLRIGPTPLTDVTLLSVEAWIIANLHVTTHY